MKSESALKHQELTQKVIGVFFEVYNELSHGFLESVYQKSFELALRSKGLRVFRKIEVPVWFRGHQVGEFEADILVEKCLLLELKAVRALDSAHMAQLLNYLRATEIEVGLLFNFGIKPDFKRVAFDNTRKHNCQRTNLLDAMLKADKRDD
ncbi:MAG: GxxExxY protein [Pyrinomonadaceae bacterium]|nr:GxxExxY protein [Pyrinomonadaceae bacterium]